MSKIKKTKFKKTIWALIALIAVFVFCYIVAPSLLSKGYLYSDTHGSKATGTTTPAVLAVASSTVTQAVSIPVTHVPAPADIKGLYMTSWVASSKKIRQHVIDLLDTTEANALVIDIKDYSGKIAFKVKDPYLQKIGSAENRISDIGEFLNELHGKHVYVIGRIAVFQDAYLSAKRPELAVKRKDGVAVWKDRKGISWLDAGSKEVWDYNTAIAKEAYSIGFDELNFDYIRFPSDGDMKDISYPFSGNKEKSDVLKGFFAYLSTELRGTGPKISADLFGMVTTNYDDLGIGQVLEKALPYFDYIDPMVYPSHYPAGFIGYKNPADHPYEVVSFCMNKAMARVKTAETTSSTTPAVLRPWLQDFNLGAVYTADMVRTQFKATYDSSLNSWLLWDPNNKYTVGSLLAE